ARLHRGGKEEEEDAPGEEPANPPQEEGAAPVLRRDGRDEAEKAPDESRREEPVGRGDLEPPLRHVSEFGVGRVQPCEGGDQTPALALGHRRRGARGGPCLLPPRGPRPRARARTTGREFWAPEAAPAAPP